MFGTKQYEVTQLYNTNFNVDIQERTYLSY